MASSGAPQTPQLSMPNRAPASRDSRAFAPRASGSGTSGVGSSATRASVAGVSDQSSAAISGGGGDGYL